MENGLNEKNGEIIELKYPLNSKDPTSERYIISSQQANTCSKSKIETLEKRVKKIQI